MKGITLRARRAMRRLLKRKRPRVKTSSSRETGISLPKKLPKRTQMSVCYEKSEKGPTKKPITKKGSKSEETVGQIEIKDYLKQDVKRYKKRIQQLIKQMDQERKYYEEEKWKFRQELRAAILPTSNTATQTYSSDSDSEEDTSLAEELRQVRMMFYKQREVTCKICEKFLKLRDFKDQLVMRMKRNEKVYITVIDELLKHLAETRIYFATVKKGVLLEKSVIGRLIDKNAKLGYNNAILQMELVKASRSSESFAKSDIDSLNSNVKFYRSTDTFTSSSCPKAIVSGSCISIPISVTNGDSTETRYAPLFTVIDPQPKEKQQRRKIQCRSVPSKIWQLKQTAISRYSSQRKTKSLTVMDRIQ